MKFTCKLHKNCQQINFYWQEKFIFFQLSTWRGAVQSENTTKSIFCGNFSSCGSPPVFLYRFVGKLSCSGVDQEGFPGLTPPSTAAENDLPVFQQNFAGYLYKGNMGKVDQQTFSAVEKTITWCKADRQVGKRAAGCKISLNGVENQSVLAGLNVNQVVERQPVFLGNTLWDNDWNFEQNSIVRIEWEY